LLFFVEKNKGRKCNGGGGEGGRSPCYKLYFVSNIVCKNNTTSLLFTSSFLIPFFLQCNSLNIHWWKLYLLRDIAKNYFINKVHCNLPTEIWSLVFLFLFANFQIVLQTHYPDIILWYWIWDFNPFFFNH
jgi:hypothetical protein